MQRVTTCPLFSPATINNNQLVKSWKAKQGSNPSLPEAIEQGGEHHGKQRT
jgi:hypothetical protein